MEVRKSDGSFEEFDRRKITNVIKKAFKSANVECCADCVKEIVDSLYVYDGMLCSSIRKQIEERLGERDESVMLAYRADREKKKRIEDFVEGKKEFIASYKKAYNAADGTIDDNSNVAAKNIAVINTEIHKPDNIQISRAMVMDKLRELYPDFNAKSYVRDIEKHVIYKNDESSFAGAIAPYCTSITMYPFLTGGIKGIGGLSAAPKNLDSFCGMYCNLIFAVSSQYAGAVATSEFLMYFTHFCKKEWGDDFFEHPGDIYKVGPKLRRLLNETHYWTRDIKELSEHDFGTPELNALRDEIVADATRPLTESELAYYTANIKSDPHYALKLGDGTRTISGQIHQYFQQVIYTISQPSAARGFQSAFVNFSYFDRPFFDGMFGNFYFPDGSRPDWESLSWMEKEFMMWFNNERLRCILTFPVESATLLYKDGEFVDKDMFNFVCDEYARGHSFFTYISDTVDSLSSCCRLKNKIQTKEFNFTNGNIGIQTGSKSVISLNMSRIVQDWAIKEFGVSRGSLPEIGRDLTDAEYTSLKKHLNKILERVYKYHTAYNELLWDMYDAGLLPVYTAGFIGLNKQYLTIGINGVNQAAEYLGMKCTDNSAYSKFCQEMFGDIKDQNTAHKVSDGKHKLTFNTECVPAESLAAKNYNWDKEDGYWVPSDTNLYASYIFKPNDDRMSVQEKIRLHGRNYIGDYLDGGSAAHINLDAHLSSKQYAHILEYAAKNGCSYITFNIPNCQCDNEKCGYIAKQPFKVCPKCGCKSVSLYDRIIGYLTKVKNWSNPRRYEQENLRVYSHVDGQEFMEGTIDD